MKKLMLILLLWLPTILLAQSNLFKSQLELIGTKTDEVQVTHFLQNKPADAGFDKKFKVLEFWATYCKPCLKAVPHLNKLQEHFKAENIIFLSITYESPAKTLPTLQKVKFETVVVSDTTKVIHRKLKIENNETMPLPRTVLIDDENKIVWYGSPKELTETIIRNFLNKEALVK